MTPRITRKTVENTLRNLLRTRYQDMITGYKPMQHPQVIVAISSSSRRESRTLMMQDIQDRLQKQQQEIPEFPFTQIHFRQPKSAKYVQNVRMSGGGYVLLIDRNGGKWYFTVTTSGAQSFGFSLTPQKLGLAGSMMTWNEYITRVEHALNDPRHNIPPEVQLSLLMLFKSVVTRRDATQAEAEKIWSSTMKTYNDLISVQFGEVLGPALVNKEWGTPGEQVVQQVEFPPSMTTGVYDFRVVTKRGIYGFSSKRAGRKTTNTVKPTDIVNMLEETSRTQKFGAVFTQKIRSLKNTPEYKIIEILAAHSAEDGPRTAIAEYKDFFGIRLKPGESAEKKHNELLNMDPIEAERLVEKVSQEPQHQTVFGDILNIALMNVHTFFLQFSFSNQRVFMENPENRNMNSGMKSHLRSKGTKGGKITGERMGLTPF